MALGVTWNACGRGRSRRRQAGTYIISGQVVREAAEEFDPERWRHLLIIHGEADFFPRFPPCSLVCMH